MISSVRKVLDNWGIEDLETIEEFLKQMKDCYPFDLTASKVIQDINEWIKEECKL